VADEDLIIRATVDASGTQSGAAQAAAAFNELKAAQDAVGASASAASASTEAFATSLTASVNAWQANTTAATTSAAATRDAAASQRELAAAIEETAAAQDRAAGRRYESALGPDTSRTVTSAGSSAAVLGTSLSAAASADSVARDAAIALRVAEAEKAAAIASAGMAGEVAAQRLIGYAAGSRKAADSANVFAKDLKLLNQAEVATSTAQAAASTEQFAQTLIGAQTFGRTGREAAVDFAAAMAVGDASTKRLVGSLEEAERSAVKLNFATAGAAREFLSLGRDVVTGQFSRMGPSLLVLGERVGGLQTLVSGFNATTLGMGAAFVAAAGGLAYLIYQLHEEKTAIEEISAAGLLTGQTEPGNINFDAIRESLQRLKDEFGATTKEARSVAEAFAPVTNATVAQKQALEGLAVAQAHFTHGDVKKIAEEEAKAIQGGAAGLAKYEQEMGILTEAEKTVILTHNNEADALQMLIDKLIQARDAGIGAFERLDEKAKQFQRTIEGAAGAMDADPFALQGLQRAFPEAERPVRPGDTSGMNQSKVGQYKGFLKSQLGYSDTDAGALIGQLQQESSLNPLDKSQGGEHQGLADWDPTRFAQLKEYAKSIGGDYADWQVQLRFANEEIKKMAPEFFKTQNLLEKTTILTGKWEKPALPGAPGFDAEVNKRFGYAQAATQESPLQRESPQSAATTKDIDEGNKKLLEREKIQTQLNTVTAAYNATVTALSTAVAGGDEKAQATLTAQALAESSSMRNLQLRIDATHTEEEADVHRAEMARISSEREAAQRINDQATLQKLAQQEAEEEQRYAGSSSAARVEAEQKVQKAKEAASKDALAIELINIDKAKAAQKGAQAELDAIAQKRAVFAAQGLQNTPEARQLDVAQATAQRQLNDENYQEFVAKERLKIQELKGEPAAIAAVYADWLDQLKNIYGQDEKEYARVQREKVAATQAATSQSIQQEMRRIEAITQVHGFEIGARKAELGTDVDGQRLTKQQEFLQLTKEIDAAAREEEGLYQKIATSAIASEDQRIAALMKVMEISARAREQEIQDSQRISDAVEKDAKASASAYVSFYGGAESSLERFTESAIQRTGTARERAQELEKSLSTDVIKTLFTGASTGIAHGIQPDLAEGKGLKDLLGDSTSKLFGNLTGGVVGTKPNDGTDALQTSAKLAAGEMKIGQDAQQKVNQLLGISASATQSSTVATTVDTAATKTGTASQLLDNTAKGTAATTTAANSLATSSNTLSTVANTTAETSNTASQAAGGLLKAASSLPIVGPLISGLAGLFATQTATQSATQLAGTTEITTAISVSTAAIVGAIGAAATTEDALLVGLEFKPFAKGGIVSAAGGFLSAGVQPALLHRGEMVLPQPLSEGIQDMIANGSTRGGGAGSNQANVHYAPVMNFGTGQAFASRAQFQQMLSTHSGELTSMARDALRRRRV
jgi:hypothetical protein